MSATTDMVKQLHILNEKLKPSSRQKISEGQWQKFYDQLIHVFSSATAEERVEIHIAFDDRNLLIDTLLNYLTKRIENTNKLVKRGRRDDALVTLQKGIVADAIIDGRASVDALHKLHNDIMVAAQQLRFNLNDYLLKLETPVNAYVQRAYQYYKDDNRAAAIQTLGHALQLDHTIRKNPRIGEFAQKLTGEDPYSAIITLEDSFTRNRFIEENIGRSSKSSTARGANGAQLSLIQRFLYGVFPGRRA